MIMKVLVFGHSYVRDLGQYLSDWDREVALSNKTVALESGRIKGLSGCSARCNRARP